MDEKKVCPDALESMMKYNWPGNIRELQNLIENMMTVVDDEKIGVCNLPEKIRGFAFMEDNDLEEGVSLSALEKQQIIKPF
jgi:transcriptional regulator of acetoin/glycerol metabolism